MSSNAACIVHCLTAVY